MLPRLSAPLVKDIRTGEGIAEWVLGAAAGILTSVGDVSVTKGLTTMTILVAVKGARRGLLKIVALVKGAGFGAPIQPAVLLKSQPIVGTVEHVLAGAVAGAPSPAPTEQSPPPPPAT